MGADVIGAFVLTAMTFFGVAINLKMVSSDYPRLHNKYPYINFTGFNIAFIEFTEKSWAYTRKLGFKLFLLAGVLHVLVCVLCYLLLPELNEMTVILASFTFFALASFTYLLHKITRYKD